MTRYKVGCLVGCFVGCLATASISRKLARAMIRLAPLEPSHPNRKAGVP